MPSPDTAATRLPNPASAIPEDDAYTCEDFEHRNLELAEPDGTPSPCALDEDQPAVSAPVPTATRPPTAVPRPRPTPTTSAILIPQSAAKVLMPVVTGHIVTALYRDETGAIYFGAAQDASAIAEPMKGGYAIWKKPSHGEPIPLTPPVYNLIGGIVVYHGLIFFNEAGALQRMPDDDQMHNAEAVLSYPVISQIYGHVNHALAKFTLAGQDVLLMAMGSVMDSNYAAPGVLSGIKPPAYEDFPTGRINYAPLSWLSSVTGYEGRPGGAGEVYEFARGFRNPWAMTVGFLGGQQQVFAIDNDPAFTPEKNDANLANAGDEVNDIVFGGHYGHPFAYAGRETIFGFFPPVAVLPDGSVPSGVAIAAGKLFVSLHDAGLIVEVDPVHHTWQPMMTGIQPFNLFGYDNLLYVADYGGVRVFDASGL
ncbi:MAG: hypothetical protein HYR71_07785 [Chloroflexi bacterium]|nr:hypothetical protein [Chloroflexota bacterium]